MSCSADRQIVGKISKDGIFLEQLESNPAQYLPEVTDDELGGDVVQIDSTDRCRIFSVCRPNIRSKPGWN